LLDDDDDDGDGNDAVTAACDAAENAQLCEKQIVNICSQFSVFS